MCSKFPDEMNHLFREYNLYVHVVRSQPILIETFNTMKSDTRCCKMCTYRHKYLLQNRNHLKHYGICMYIQKQQYIFVQSKKHKEMYLFLSSQTSEGFVPCNGLLQTPDAFDKKKSILFLNFIFFGLGLLYYFLGHNMNWYMSFCFSESFPAEG